MAVAVWRWKAAILVHISGALEYMGKWPLRVIFRERYECPDLAVAAA